MDCGHVYRGRHGDHTLVAFQQLFGQSLTLEVAFVATILMQFVVQGAWAMPGVYMNERSPAQARATITGLAYVAGIAIASTAATIKVLMVDYFHGNYSYSLLVLSLVVLHVLLFYGPEERREKMQTLMSKKISPFFQN